MENYVQSQSRITWGSNLATGYDRLKIGFYVNWESKSFLTQLDNAKIEAKEIDDVCPIFINDDLIFNCHATGRKGGYAYHLSRADVHIFFSRRKDFNTPNVWVDIGSQSCWSPGWQAIIQDIKNLIELNNGAILNDTISEVHLCADWIGLDIEEMPIDMFKYWITRANGFNSYQNKSGMIGVTLSQSEGTLPPGEIIQESGIELGNGDLMLRIYNKTLELKRTPAKQTLFASVWGQKEYDDEPVTRVEFQLRRQVLKQMQVNTLAELQERQGDIWKYLTYNWTRLSDQEIDRTNRHQDRAKLHPWWQEVHDIELCPLKETVKRKYPKAAKSLDVIHDLMVGCSLSLGTLLNRQFNDLDGVITFTQAAIETKLRQLWYKTDDQGRSQFQQRMKKKWSEIWPMGFEPRPI